MKTTKTPETLKPGTIVALLFSTTKHNARIHAVGCPMVNTAGASFKVRRHDLEVGSAEYSETLADLDERGFPVKFCKCCK